MAKGELQNTIISAGLSLITERNAKGEVEKFYRFHKTRDEGTIALLLAAPTSKHVVSETHFKFYRLKTPTNLVSEILRQLIAMDVWSRDERKYLEGKAAEPVKPGAKATKVAATKDAAASRVPEAKVEIRAPVKTKTPEEVAAAKAANRAKIAAVAAQRNAPVAVVPVENTPQPVA